MIKMHNFDNEITNCVVESQLNGMSHRQVVALPHFHQTTLVTIHVTHARPMKKY